MLLIVDYPFLFLFCVLYTQWDDCNIFLLGNLLLLSFSVFCSYLFTKKHVPTLYPTISQGELEKVKHYKAIVSHTQDCEAFVV